jgi:NAD(P)-dependent dehydrogenase (short-subunit alcohol dehydrogenase family)
MFMDLLTGKVAVITGGTSGIGAAAALLFAAEGATTVITGRRKDAGERLAAELSSTAAGAAVEFVRADVSDEADVEALIGHVTDRFGRLDCLVNNAGIGGTPGGVATVDMHRFWGTLSVNLGGVVLGMKHAAPVMTEQGSGSIINVASIGGQFGGWSMLDYSAAKAAVIHLTRWAATELGEHAVRVNSVSPGPVATGLFGRAAGIDAAEADQTADALESVFAKRLSSWQPIHRAAVAADVAPALVWLASDGAAFVTGQDLAVDGGISAGRPASVSAADRAAVTQALTAERDGRFHSV